jgi:hypothetical protein
MRQTHYTNLNITLQLPEEIWVKVPLVYKNMNGWLGFKDGIPFWFSYNENEK